MPSLRETWNSLTRGDRFVYGAAIVLVVLSWVPQLPEIRRLGFERLGDTVETSIGVTSSDLLRKEWDERAAPFADLGTELMIATGVALVLGWELAKSAERRLRIAPIWVVGVVLAVPIAVPAAFLGAWVASLVLRGQTEEHPLLRQVVPIPWSVGITVYVVLTALVVAALAERRARREEA